MKPTTTPRQPIFILHIMTCLFDMVITTFACIWNAIGIDIGWSFLVMGFDYWGNAAGLTVWLAEVKSYYGELTVAATAGILTELVLDDFDWAITRTINAKLEYPPTPMPMAGDVSVTGSATGSVTGSATSFPGDSTPADNEKQPTETPALPGKLHIVQDDSRFEEPLKKVQTRTDSLHDLGFHHGLFNLDADVLHLLHLFRWSVSLALGICDILESAVWGISWKKEKS
ncbi:uncharacterized protein BDR25DRAFT_348346 [Lindgomyces ingoldianus]|uniref:Uncharacterized protein n=1 Tax=Lindgomyces ingoldianus TaxID=673940 RepID=A0ACB6RFN7_9PLEO|nr:uncharacterized protein BDR25DRAFT_348346 [Lindgomyces ingoldianus]KAF2478064.1 hypothetical protein BDR25DRAFT_348346 [Lindgomyces ingoldianus]